MSPVVEKDWITAAGLRAVVLLVGGGRHRCGYVAVPEGHALHGKDYSWPHDIEVHGGLTYAGGGDGYPVGGDDLWWFGFDCAHAWDAPSEAWVQAQREKHPFLEPWTPLAPGATHRDLPYCEAECESLARQLAAQAVEPPVNAILQIDHAIFAGTEGDLPNERGIEGLRAAKAAVEELALCAEAARNILR